MNEPQGSDLLYELGAQEGNDVIYTIKEWRQVHDEFERIEAALKNAREREAELTKRIRELKIEVVAARIGGWE